MRLLIVDDSNLIRSRFSRVVQNGGMPSIAREMRERIMFESSTMRSLIPGT